MHKSAKHRSQPSTQGYKGASNQVARSTRRKKSGIRSHMKLEANPQIKLNACFVTMTPKPWGTGSVLQITSYASIERRGYPTIRMYARVDTIKPSDLAHKEIKAEISLQRKRDGPIWTTPRDQPAVVILGVSEDQTSISGRVTDGRLVSQANEDISFNNFSFGGEVRTSIQ